MWEISFWDNVFQTTVAYFIWVCFCTTKIRIIRYFRWFLYVCTPFAVGWCWSIGFRLEIILILIIAWHPVAIRYIFKGIKYLICDK